MTQGVHGRVAPVASFGPFRLLSGQRVLMEGERRIRLGSRALEILLLLVERAGELVGKQELIDRVWPSIVVDDAALRCTLPPSQGSRRRPSWRALRRKCARSRLSLRRASGAP